MQQDENTFCHRSLMSKMKATFQFTFLFCYSDSSSSSSDESPARSVQSAAVPAPSALPLSSLDKDEPRKSFGIKVQNLPVRSTGRLYSAEKVSARALFNVEIAVCCISKVSQDLLEIITNS